MPKQLPRWRSRPAIGDKPATTEANRTRAKVMASTRVRTGFHRLAIVLAVGFLIPAVIALVSAVVETITTPDARIGGSLFTAAACSVTAVILYVLTRAVGWIVEGFLG